MKKTTLTLMAVLALAAFSATAMAAVSTPSSPGAFEFTLGGYIKMESSWDSTQINKNMTGPVQRNNDPNWHHGRLKWTANSSRFNFNFKGPKVWGAQITGLIEADFDADGGVNPAAGVGTVDTVGTGRFRLRHAMFRLNWPETELMLGQFWGFFSNFTPETANDAGLVTMGAPSQRLAQIRVTQKFLGAYTAAVLVGAPFNNLDGGVAGPVGTASLGTGGESTETPQVQGMLAFEQDLWGKAPFYGVPRGFVAQVAAGWQRNRFRRFPPTGGLAGNAHLFDQDNYWWPVAIAQRDQQNLDPWMIQGSLFIPLIPTYSANLAGTASVLTQWNIGQGLAAFAEGAGQDFSYQGFAGFNPATGWFEFDRHLQKRFTGFVQGQYYFTNQWFMNVAWGMSKAFGVTRDTFASSGLVNTNTGANDPTWFNWQLHSTLWYRPITSLKFGLQYSYGKSHFFQRTGPAAPAAFPAAIPVGNSTSNGENHRVMFAGFWYF